MLKFFFTFLIIIIIIKIYYHYHDDDDHHHLYIFLMKRSINEKLGIYIFIYIFDAIWRNIFDDKIKFIE